MVALSPHPYQPTMFTMTIHAMVPNTLIGGNSISGLAICLIAMDVVSDIAGVKVKQYNNSTQINVLGSFIFMSQNKMAAPIKLKIPSNLCAAMYLSANRPTKKGEAIMAMENMA